MRECENFSRMTEDSKGVKLGLGHLLMVKTVSLRDVRKNKNEQNRVLRANAIYWTY